MFYYNDTMQYVSICSAIAHSRVSQLFHTSRLLSLLVVFSRTNTQNAAASLLFYGNAVTAYGATSVNHGPFTVQLDGGTPVTLNGSAPTLRYQNMLVGLPCHRMTV